MSLKRPSVRVEALHETHTECLCLSHREQVYPHAWTEWRAMAMAQGEAVWLTHATTLTSMPSCHMPSRPSFGNTLTE